MECPHCKSVCQIQEQYLGSQVKCGKCAKLFRAASPSSEKPSEAPTPTEPTSPAPESKPAEKPTPPQESPQQKFNPGAALGGLWSGIKGVYGSVSSSVSSSVSALTKGKLETSKSPTGDEDMALDFDGPSAEKLMEEAKQESEQEPVLGSEPESIYGEFRLDIAGATSPGRVRERNEDSFLILQHTWSNRETRQEMALVVVADGMGGYAAGDRASHLVIQSLFASLTKDLPEWLTTQNKKPPVDLKEKLVQAFHDANDLVYKEAQADKEKEGMGSTAAVVVIWNGEVQIGHVGDCRVYHVQNSTLKQVTRDQTLVARMVELGTLSPEEAETHSSRNEVTQALGRHAELKPEFNSLSLQPGEWLLVACDGLHAHVGNKKLQDIFHSAPASAILLTHYLIDLVNYRGGSDNCTIVNVRCY